MNTKVFTLISMVNQAIFLAQRKSCMCKYGLNNSKLNQNHANAGVSVKNEITNTT